MKNNLENMDFFEKKTVEQYSKLANRNDNKTIISGRNMWDEAKESFIFSDVINKLDFEEGNNFLDIGCGFSNVTVALADFLLKQNVKISLMDIKDIIQLLKNELSSTKYSSIKYLEGLFPKNYDFNNPDKFDRILSYSVLHYIDSPLDFVMSLTKLLKPRGKLLLGDLPNINKKGRFISSKFGREFEANYRKVPIDKIPQYKNHHEFVKVLKEDPNIHSLIDDEFILNIYSLFSNEGYDVYILPQPKEVPFCLTRVDILICKND